MLRGLYNKRYMSIALHTLAFLAVCILLAAFFLRFDQVRAASSRLYIR